MSEIVSANQHEESKLEFFSEKYERALSLFDLFKSLENLSIETRRQNKILRSNAVILEKVEKRCESLDDKITDLGDTLYISTVQASHTSANSMTPSEISDTEAKLPLIQAMDTMFTILKASQDCFASIASFIPAKLSFWRRSKPQWQIQMEQVAQEYTKGIEIAEEKMRSFLLDVKIEVISPLCHTPFDPTLHRAVGTMSGTNKHTVAKLVRYGFKMKDRLVRAADVIIYE